MILPELWGTGKVDVDGVFPLWLVLVMAVFWGAYWEAGATNARAWVEDDRCYLALRSEILSFKLDERVNDNVVYQDACQFTMQLDSNTVRLFRRADEESPWEEAIALPVNRSICEVAPVENWLALGLRLGVLGLLAGVLMAAMT